MKYVIALLFLLAGTGCFAQKEFEDRQMTWFGLFNQTRFTEKSGMWLDLHWRLNDEFINETHALLARAGYTYYFTDRTRLTFGYAWQLQPGHNGAPDVAEHRPWQQIQWSEKKKYFQLMQWIRTEQRYRSVDGQDFEYSNFRFRYNIALTIPLNNAEIGPNTISAFTNNELFINAGKNINYNYFDQNRFFVGLAYHFSAHTNLQVGYMNIFQQLNAPNQYVRTDAIRVFFFHNIDLRDNASH